MIEPGTHTLGPGDGTLTVLTGKSGAAAKAGHNLTIEVTRWDAVLAGGEPLSLSLRADARSLRVRAGSGGMSPLGDEEKAGIAQTIDEEVLKGAAIQFRSSSVEASGQRLDVSGELELAGVKRPLDFALQVSDDGRLTGSALIKQTDFRLKPYSALFGTLKVADEVKVAIDARIPPAVPAPATAARSEQHG